MVLPFGDIYVGHFAVEELALDQSGELERQFIDLLRNRIVRNLDFDPLPKLIPFVLPAGDLVFRGTRGGYFDLPQLDRSGTKGNLGVRRKRQRGEANNKEA